MKLRKMIPAVFMTVIAVLLSVVLFDTAIPKAQAVREVEELSILESGYVYGTDRTLYRYCYSMEFGTHTDAFTSKQTPAIILKLEVDQNTKELDRPFIVVDELVYIPEVDDYVERTMLAGGNGIGYVVGTNVMNYQVDYGGEMMDGEVVEITALYCLDGRVLASLTWNKEAMTK